MPPANDRPTRTRRPPGWTRDYEMTEMSVIRRPSSSMVEDVGVGGMLDDDILGTRLREATRGPATGRACADAADATSGRDRPGSENEKTTCVRNVLIGMRDLCRKNGLSEVFTHYMVGRMAMDLCDVDPPI